jgi:hypothetical protein
MEFSEATPEAVIGRAELLIVFLFSDRFSTALLSHGMIVTF